MGTRVTLRTAFTGAALLCALSFGVPGLVTGVQNAGAVTTRPVAAPCPTTAVPTTTGPTTGPVTTVGVTTGPVKALLTPVEPARNVLIGNRQNGTTVCLSVGDRLLVSLSAPAGKGLQWHRIVASPAGILVHVPLPVTTARLVTSTDFLARRQGKVHLTSERWVCPPAAPGKVTCQAIVLWRVAVVVRGFHRILPHPGKFQPLSVTATG